MHVNEYKIQMESNSTKLFCDSDAVYPVYRKELVTFITYTDALI